MRRRLLVALLATAATACDPMLPLRVMDEVQPVASVNLLILSYSDGFAALRAGSHAVIAAEALDKGGNPVDLTDKKLTWTISDPGVGEISEQVPGLVHVEGRLKGPAVVSVEVDGKTATVGLVVVPGPAHTISVVPGSATRAVAGYSLATPLVFEVRDQYANALESGTTVTFTAPNGALSSSSQQTNAQGRVQVSWTPSITGNHVVTARIGSTVSATAPISVTTLGVGFAGAAPTTARNAIALTPAPAVQLKYASDNAAFARQGVAVQATVMSGSATLGATGATAQTDANGIATFGNFVLTGTAGPVSVRFRAGTSDTTVTLSLVGGLATRLALATPLPQTAVSGRPMSQVPVIQLLDANNNPVEQSGVVVNAMVPVGYSVTTTQATTDATGRATFTGLAVSGTLGATVQISFSAAGVANFTAPSLLLTGPETNLAMQRFASTCACDSIPSTTPQVRLRDAGNRAVAQAGITITATLPAGATGVTLMGGTAVTDADGVATFDALKLSGPTGNYTLTFASGTLSPVNMGATLVAGSPRALTVVAQPPDTAQNGVTFSPAPQVRVVDACSNFTSTFGLSVTAGVTSGTVTMANGTVTTSSGVASFSSLSMAGLARTYLLRFTAPGLQAAVATDSTVLKKGVASRLTLTTQPSSTARSGVPFTVQPVVQVQDVGGNPVAGARTVTASIYAATPSGGASLGNASATIASTDSVATFSTMTLTGIAGSYKLVFVAPGLQTDTTMVPVVLGGAGTASRMVIETLPSTAALAGAVLARTPVVRLVDVNGDSAKLAGLMIQAGADLFSESGHQVVTNSSGVASFGSLWLSGSAQTADTIEFTASGLTEVSAGRPTVMAQALFNGSGISLAAAAGIERHYGIVVPSGQSTLSVELAAGSGDANIYVARADAPDRASAAYLCSAAATGSGQELCVIPNPPSGQYFILVHGVTTYSSRLLRATYAP